jgi:hypothetical protein
VEEIEIVGVTLAFTVATTAVLEAETPAQPEVFLDSA